MSANLKPTLPEQLCLHIFGITVLIRSDSKTFIENFRSMYRRFEISDFSSFDEKSLEFTLITKLENPWGKPVLLMGEEVWPYEDSATLESYSYEVVLSRILAEVREYFLIHAAVISWRDRGVIISADSGHGKTTLALRLTLDGYKYLSDEIAAISRSDHLVYPFPRSVRVKGRTLDLIGLQELALSTPVWGDKLLLDIEGIVPGCIGSPVPINYIFIIKSPLLITESSPRHSDKDLGVLVNQLDGTILGEIAKIEGVDSVYRDTYFGYPLLRLKSNHRMRILRSVEELCIDHGILILDVYKRDLRQPVFDSAVESVNIPNSQAAMELLRQFQPGHKSYLLREELGNSPTKMYVELAGLIDCAACYQITPGPLEEMIKIIKDKVG